MTTSSRLNAAQTANALLTLKTWADKTGTDLTRLNHRGIEKALAETGLTALDITRLAGRASTFTQADYDALIKANQLSGELNPAAQAQVPQRDVFATGPTEAETVWFDQHMGAAEEAGWKFEVSIDFWPDKTVHAKGALEALAAGKTLIASREVAWHSPDTSYTHKSKVERPFTTVGGLKGWLESQESSRRVTSEDVAAWVRDQSRSPDAPRASGGTSLVNGVVELLTTSDPYSDM